MKKIIATLLTIVTCLCTLGIFSSCSDETTEIRIGYLQGPTGMGMAKLINDNGGQSGNEKYSFINYQNDTEKAKADLSLGNVDIICVPTNEAAAYHAKNDDTVVLAVNCLNSLYLVSDKNSSVTSLADLEGKTVYTCKNGTPKMILDYVIKELGLNITVSTSTPDGKVMAKPADVKNQMVNVGDLPYVVLPEPIITAAQLEIQKNGNTNIAYSVDVNFSDEWEKISDTPAAMGCIITTKKFANDNAKAIEAFLKEYKASIEFTGNEENLDLAAKYVAEAQIMAAEAPAKKALGNLGSAISYIDGANMKDTLEAFYAALGIALPDDGFYYEANK